MKQTMKRIICLILVVIMAASFMVACQGGDNQNTKRSTTSRTVDPEGPVIPDDAYYDGASVRIYSRNNNAGSSVSSDAEYLLLEFKGNQGMNAKLNDAVMKRNTEVEDLLGVKLDITAEPGLMDGVGGGGGSSDTWLKNMKAAAINENGNDLFDIAAIYASQGSAFAAQGCFLDVNLLPEGTIDLDRIWWNQSLQEELEIDGALFMLGGDISLSSSAFACAIFYNKSLFDQHFANDYSEGGFQETYDYIPHDENTGVTLYDIVNEYEWTMDVLSDISSKLYVNKGTPGKDQDDEYGLVLDSGSNTFDSWIAALDIKFINKNENTGEIKLAFEDAESLRHANNAYNKVKDLITINQGVYAFDGTGAVSKFADGEAMFVMCRLCDAESFRNTDDWDYGILPLPKYDNSLGEYSTLPANHYSLIVVAANLENNRAKMVGYTLELLAAKSYKLVTPAYYNLVLKSDYSDRPEDADMYDLITRNIKMEFATIYSTLSLNGIALPIRMGGNSFAQNWKSSEREYKSALETLVSGLKTQAELQRKYSN